MKLINPLKSIRYAILCLFSIILIQACRKDNLNYDRPDFTKPLISQKAIQAWLDENPISQIVSLDWSKAKQAIIEGKNVVRIPTRNIDLISTLQSSSISKQQSQTALKGNSIQPRVSGSASQNSATGNYYPSHPPELIFVEVQGKLEVRMLNFIPNDINKGFGQEGIWSGKVMEWNLRSDTVLVQNIEKNKFTDVSLLTSGKSSQKLNDNLKSSLKQSISGLHDKTTSNFWAWLGGIWDGIVEALTWIGWQLGIPGISGYHDEERDGHYLHVNGWGIDLSWLFGDGSGGNSNDGGGASYGSPTSSYPYLGLGQPIYNDYVYGNQSPDGSGNVYYSVPYINGGGGGMPMPIAANVTFFNSLSITDNASINFINAHDDIKTAISGFLNLQGYTTVNIEIAKASILHLAYNQMVDLDDFKYAISYSNELFNLGSYIESNQFDPGNDDWLDKIRKLQEKIERLGQNPGSELKKLLSAQVDRALIFSLKAFAESKFPGVSALNETQKQGEFNFASGDRGAMIMLFEFATGTGHDSRSFVHDQNITQKLIAGPKLTEIYSEFYRKVNQFNLSYSDFQNLASPITSGLAFSPDHTTIQNSFNQHVSANLVQLIIGGSVIKYESSVNDGWVDVTITNSTSRNSVLLHAAEDYDRDGSGNNKPLSTIKQVFKFSILIDKSKFH